MSAHAHDVRVTWEERHFPHRSDAGIQRDLEWVWGTVRPVGRPYGRYHHEWTAARTAILREARRRGLDLSVVKLT